MKIRNNKWITCWWTIAASFLWASEKAEVCGVVEVGKQSRYLRITHSLQADPQWVLIAHGTSTVSSEGFGGKAFMSGNGDCIAIASPQYDRNRGKVDISKIDQKCKTVIPIQTIYGDKRGELLSNVAISRDCNYLVLGAHKAQTLVNGITKYGRIRVYKFNDTTNRFVPRGPDMYGIATTSGDGSFGIEPSISDDGRRVGAGEPRYGGRVGLVDEGRYLTFDWDEVGSTWFPTGVLPDPPAPASDPYRYYSFGNWGSKLSGDGKTLVVCAVRWKTSGKQDFGAIFVYRWSDLDSKWTFFFSDHANYKATFGFDADISHDGKYLVVGAPTAYPNNRPGRVHLYKRNDKTATYDRIGGPIIHPSSGNNDFCGMRVGLSSNNRILVGCIGVGLWHHPTSPPPGWMYVVEFDDSGVLTNVGSVIAQHGWSYYVGDHATISTDGNRIFTATPSWPRNHGRFLVHDLEGTRPADLMDAPDDMVVPCNQVPSVHSPTAHCERVTFTYDGQERLERDQEPCEDAYTLVRTWTATDNGGNSETESQTIEVHDLPPQVSCNIHDICPKDVNPSSPKEFTPTVSHSCDSSVNVSIQSYACTKKRRNGKMKSARCSVEINGDTARVSRTGGVGTHIVFEVLAETHCGTQVTKTCGLDVLTKDCHV